MKNLKIIVLCLFINACNHNSKSNNNKSKSNKSNKVVEQVLPLVKKQRFCVYQSETDTVQVLMGFSIEENKKMNKYLIRNISDDEDLDLEGSELLISKKVFEDVRIDQLLFFKKNVLYEVDITLNSESKEKLFDFILQNSCYYGQSFTYRPREGNIEHSIRLDFDY